jgi:phosphoinositide-3-kinase regulatory subunit 4
VVTSSIRNCLWPSSRLHGLQLFLNLSPYLMDEDKVDRIVPFVVELLSDDVAIVRAEACRALVTVVRGPPSLSVGLTDPDVFVRATYARGLVRLADAAVLMLEMSQAARVPKSEIEASGIVEVSLSAQRL